MPLEILWRPLRGVYNVFRSIARCKNLVWKVLSISSFRDTLWGSGDWIGNIWSKSWKSCSYQTKQLLGGVVKTKNKQFFEILLDRKIFECSCKKTVSLRCNIPAPEKCEIWLVHDLDFIKLMLDFWGNSNITWLKGLSKLLYFLEEYWKNDVFIHIVSL